MKERNDWASLQERIARVARYANAIKGIGGFKGYRDESGWDDDYKKAHPVPEVWYQGVRYKWDKRRNKYLHWTTLPSGKKKAEEPPYEATYPLFGDYSKPFNAFRKEEPNAGEKPLAPMTANHPIGSEKDEKPKQLSLFGESEETTSEKKKTVQKTAPAPKKKEKKEPEKPSARPMSLFDVPSYTDRNEPRDLLSFDNPKQEPDPEQKPEPKEREPQPDRKTKEERLQKIAEKVGQKKKSESGSLKERQLAEILAHNPMSDEYHTGIRTLDDIHSAQEVFNPDDPDAGDYLDLYPDFTLKDAANALKSGYVTIYGSSELKSGAFVTPSRMNAQDYAGGRNAKIFSKRVPINAVAWIDGTEGQYCPEALKSGKKTKTKTTKERLRQVAEKAAGDEKPLAPMTASGPASRETPQKDILYAQNAEDFAAIADRVRGEIMSSRAAKKDDAETQKDVDDFHEVVPLFADIKKKVRETGKSDPEDDKIWDEKIQPFLNNCAQSFAKTLTRPERERNLAFLKAAFPDRGGSTFFSDDYIEETIELFKKKKIKVKANDLRYVFDAYNVLGKSFNAKGKWYSPPRFSFNFNENKNHGGSFDARFNKIDINPNPESTMGPQTALIHELGHWLEDNILGIDVKGETREWLAKETGDGENFPGINDYAAYRIPHEKAPVLGYRFDGYSMIAYPLQAFYDDRREFRRDKGGTEIFSTGMEGLVRRPDYFARCNPKHFTRMIECFSKLFKDNKE